jgi:uncharacterized membrane protein YsdA (DUF1294 family)
VINSLCFLTFGYDKWRAKNNKRRISEFNLLLLGVVGGTIGGFLGMQLFRHKTNKTSFMMAFYTIATIQVVLIYFGIQSLEG